MKCCNKGSILTVINSYFCVHVFYACVEKLYDPLIIELVLRTFHSTKIVINVIHIMKVSKFS